MTIPERIVEGTPPPAHVEAPARYNPLMHFDFEEGRNTFILVISCLKA